MTASQTELPALESCYEDEYGPIDLEVYRAASAIWPAAESFGNFVLHDQALAFNFMLQAAARVTARIASDQSKIENLQAYLFRTYKHLIGQEKAKQLQRSQPLTDLQDSLVVDIVEDLERKIMLRELFSQLNEADRTLALDLMLGYTYEEIAKRMNLPVVSLRSRFSRLKRKLWTIVGQQKAPR